MNSCKSLFAIVIACSLATTNAKAELLSQDKLADCQMHVVGIYSPTSSKDDRIYVTVADTGSPMVLVMTGYFGAQWNLDIQPGADVKQIIVAGYFEHSLVGAAESIPVEFRTHFGEEDPKKRDPFWAYSLTNKNGRELKEHLMELTGLDIHTFQGEYSANKFTIDGKRGRLGNEKSKITDATKIANAVAETIAAHAQEQGLKARAELAQAQAMKTQAAKAQLEASKIQAANVLPALEQEYAATKRMLDRFKKSYGEGHPGVRDRVEAMKALELMLSEAAVLSEAAERLKRENVFKNQPKKPETMDQQAVIKQLVKQSFKLELELQKARLAKAQSDLDQVKKQIQMRVENADKIIAQRVKELLENSSPANQAIKPPTMEQTTMAERLAAEGWNAWNKHDSKTALQKFEAAVKLDGTLENARNGLGWAYFQSGEPEKAIREFKSLLQDMPDHVAAANGIGQSLLALGRFHEAEMVLLKATNAIIDELGEEQAVKANMTASWHGLINAYLQMGENEKAKQWAERYLKYQPDHAPMKEFLNQANAKINRR